MDNEDCHDFEGDVTMKSSTGSVRVQMQKEIVYNKLLPYADKLDDEAQAFLIEIKGNLGRAVMLREMRPGCSVWTTKLCKYIKIYGMKFSKEDHILFIKLIYELITIPNLEPFLVNKFGSTLVLLLKKKELISPDELELPWKPLYELIYKLTEGQMNLGIYRYFSPLGPTLNALVHAAKVYFPLSATREILDELRPTFCPFDGSTMLITIGALDFFLPLQLPPEHHSLGFQLWFDEFMTFWEVCHNAPECENNMVWLMGRLASNNIGYIDWEPHIPLMFTRFVRCLNLPVSYKNTQSSRHHKIETTPIAMWIVSVLGKNSSAQIYLDKFLKTVETFFHPANYGRWLMKLKELLRKLPYYFTLRVHKERYGKPTWETPVPDSHKLTDEDIDAFVKSMMPVAMTAMFSRSGLTDACHALQHLAIIRPSLVIPNVLERMYSTFDSVTEPHKLTSSMICMLAVARPMVQGSRNCNKGYTFPEGPSHVLPLLFSSLPGIDPNDAEKCFTTFRLISVYTTLVPVVDSSRTTADLDEDDRLVCEATSRFEDFILQFMDRIFALIDSSALEFVRMENRVGDEKSRLETSSERELIGVCTAILMQTSDAIFESALHKLRAFVTERILETKIAGKLAAVLCRIFARINGRDTLRVLLPVLSQTILDTIGEGDEVAKEENLDKRLLYAMLLLAEMVDTAGNNLLPHVSVLTRVLDKILHLKSREGCQIACQLLKSMLLSLSVVAPREFRSVKRNYNNPDYPHVKDWGQAESIDELKVKWYVPGKEEIAAVQELFLRYLPPEVARIERFIANKDSLTREELQTSLSVINNIIGGCELLLPVWTEPALVPLASALPWTSYLPTIGISGEVTMADGSNVRRYLAGIMSNLQECILKNAEDDIKSLSVLVEIWKSLLLGKARSGAAYERRLKMFRIAKKVLEDKLVGKKGLFSTFILERADIQHDARLQSRKYCITETHRHIMLELLKLSVSRYANIRYKSQLSLFCALQNFPYSYMYLVPQLVEILSKDPEEHHEAFKGVLYILLGPDHDLLITKRDWSLLKVLWPAVVLSKPSEKPSVIRLKERLVESIHKHFPTTAITLEIPTRCVDAASALWKTLPRPSVPQPNENEIENGLSTLKKQSERNMQLYNDLLNKLLRAIVEGNLHWRHRAMAMSFIRDLVHPDQAYPANVVRYFLESLIHDSLQERKIAIRTVGFMLQQQKREHAKITVDTSTFPGQPIEPKRIPGHRPDNAWLQYDYATRPVTAEQWDQPRYAHHSYTGYYAWPKKLELYAPSSQQPCLDPSKRELSAREKEVDLFFGDPRNVDKLIKYFSLEEKKGKDKFNGYRLLLFRGLFRNHGTTHLRHFLPHLRRLVADSHESSQRCAAEIVAGIIRGSKHWPFEMVEEMWDGLLPIIRTALSNLTNETVVDWGLCSASALHKRDPNRSHWLLECLMEEPPLGESETSFAECGRLYVLESAIGQQSWRLTQLLHRLLARIEDRLLTNPLQNVRDRIGTLLVTIYEADLDFPNAHPERQTPRVQNNIERVMPRLRILVEDLSEAGTAAQRKTLSSLIDGVSLEENGKPKNAVKDTEREGAIRLLKTFCKWMVGSISRSQYGGQRGFYQLFPIICQLVNSETDEELTKICSASLAVLAQALTLPKHMGVALEAVGKVSSSSSWSTRATCLEFLQVLIFHNMSIVLSNDAWVGCTRDIVLCLLEDERLEVREMAGQVLGGLLHCTFIPDQETLLERFKAKAKTRLPKRKNRDSAERAERDRNAEATAIRLRHAGVLGLCAFIQAHPYDVPKYMPPIFEHLGPHLSDPQPIPTTIRKTLGDFKRTHYDGWSNHALQFTEEQLEVLQDLSAPPSYYA